MKNYKWFMGIDVSKGKLDITVLEGSDKLLYSEIENTQKGILHFIKDLRSRKDFKIEDCLICMEHTGIYNAHLLVVSEQQKWNLCMESGAQIKLSGGIQRGQNDVVDSYRIALYAYKHQSFINLWIPHRSVVSKLKKLSGMRSRLINAKKQLSQTVKEDKQFQDAKLTKILQGCCQRTISSIQKDIEKTEKQISLVIKSDEELNRLFNIVESVPGIGRVVATELVVTTNEFKNIKDARKYACYSGVAPFEHTSGSSIRGKSRTSRKANMDSKALLHMASLVAAFHSEELSIYYNRKVEAGKNKMSVLNAIKNKLLHRVFACINENRTYEKHYLKKVA